MPRGFLRDREYRKADISSYILELMHKKKVRQYHLAAALNITQGRVSQKLETCDFDVGELIIIFQLLDAEPEKVGKLLVLKD